MKIRLCAAGLALLGSVGACSGGVSPDRPTQAEVSRAMSGNSSSFGAAIPDAAIPCIAKVLVESDVSDKTLKAIVKGKNAFSGNEDDQMALQELTPDFSECVTDSD